MDKAHAGGAVEIYCDVWGVSIFRTALTVLRNTSLLPRSSGSTNFDPSSHLVRIFGFSGTGVLSSSVLFLVSAILNLPPPSRLSEAYHLSSRTAAREPSGCEEHVADRVVLRHIVEYQIVRKGVSAAAWHFLRGIARFAVPGESIVMFAIWTLPLRAYVT